MKRYYLVIILLVTLFVLPLGVSADCTYSEKVRLQKLATNVNFSYRYTETQYTITFQVTVSNLTNEIYMIDQSTGKRYYADNKDFTINDYMPGQKLKFDFYVKDTSCSKTSIFTNYVTLPSYNPYYNSEICKGIEDYKLCQKWLKHDMTYKEFYDSVKAYKNKETITPTRPKEDGKFDWETIIDIWSKYYIYILMGIIIVCVGTIYIYDKKSEL